MTRDNHSRRKDVRAYMARHDGMSYTQALRALEDQTTPHEPRIELTSIIIGAEPPPGGWQDHEFALTYEDLFRCVNCGQYEVSLTRADKSLPPCQPTPEFVAERERAKAAEQARAAAWRPRCSYARELDYDPDMHDPGDYLTCVLSADHGGPHQMMTTNANDY